MMETIPALAVQTFGLLGGVNATLTKIISRIFVAGVIFKILLGRSIKKVSADFIGGVAVLTVAHKLNPIAG